MICCLKIPAVALPQMRSGALLYMEADLGMCDDEAELV